MLRLYKSLEEEIKERLSSAKTSAELERVRIDYFGKKGKVTLLLHKLKDIPVEERKEHGKELNIISKKYQHLIGELKNKLQNKNRAIWDISREGRRQEKGSRHPLTIVEDEIKEIFVGMGFEFVDSPYIETDWYNFEALNVPPHHPSREMQDTFYIKNVPGLLLRTQTSPVQIRQMLKRKPPIRIGHIGRVYRVDDFDATHAPCFTQFEGLYVDKGVSFADLKGTIIQFVRELFGKNAKLKLLPSYFPFTEPSAEVYMQWKGDWMEISGCGMVHPNVLGNVGIDADKYTGFAFGMGIERVAMIKYGISDIRLLSENNIGFLNQF